MNIHPLLNPEHISLTKSSSFIPYKSWTFIPYYIMNIYPLLNPEHFWITPGRERPQLFWEWRNRSRVVRPQSRRTDCLEGQGSRGQGYLRGRGHRVWSCHQSQCGGLSTRPSDLWPGVRRKSDRPHRTACLSQIWDSDSRGCADSLLLLVIISPTSFYFAKGRSIGETKSEKLNKIGILKSPNFARFYTTVTQFGQKFDIPCAVIKIWNISLRIVSSRWSECMELKE